MRDRSTLPLCLTVAILTLRAAAPVCAEPPATEAVRESIARSLPYLEQAGEEWIEEKDCVACHRISFMTWGFREAARQGFEVDPEKLQGWLDWSVAKSVAPTDDGEKLAGENNADGVTQLLLGHTAAGPAAMSAETAGQLVALVLKTQQDNGAWKPAGQLPGQKRPPEETRQVSTMWNLLALRTAGTPAAIAAADQRAVDWLAERPLGKSTEWYAVRLLLAVQQDDPSATTAAIEQLRERQHEDGGWGWLVDDASDALGTGQALYALAQAGVPATDPLIADARRFLISTQAETGSWPVRGTKAKKQDRVEETATYWGTAWAAIGLLATLPEPAAFR